MKARFFLFVLSGLCWAGCSLLSHGVRGDLGYGPDRKVVIVGEKVASKIALYYQHKYDAKVWYTPAQGLVEDSAKNILKGIGPSGAMKSLINELESINYSVGRWEIIVPAIAEGYFLSTLSHMADGSLSHARGDILLIDSKGNKDLEAQVARVSGGNFLVSFASQKD